MYKPVDQNAIAWHDGTGGPMVVRTKKKVIFRDEHSYVVDAYFEAWQAWGGHHAYLPVRCANLGGYRRFQLRPQDWAGIDLPQQIEPDAIDAYGAIYKVEPEGFHERVSSILQPVAATIFKTCIDYLRIEFAQPSVTGDEEADLIFRFFDGLELT